MSNGESGGWSAGGLVLGRLLIGRFSISGFLFAVFHFPAPVRGAGAGGAENGKQETGNRKREMSNGESGGRSAGDLVLWRLLIGRFSISGLLFAVFHFLAGSRAWRGAGGAENEKQETGNRKREMRNGESGGMER